jgi:glutaredoxin
MLIVYSKSNCPFCVKAKHLLTTKNIEFKTVNIEEDSESREWLIAQGHKAVPQIYKDDQLFVEGGYQGLIKLTEQQFKEKLGV